MKKIISLLLVCIMTTFAGCVHNQNRKTFQPSILTTKHRTMPVD